MEIFRSSSRYISPHHNILGPARLLPYERRGWNAPIFNFGRSWGGHFHHHRPFFGGFGFGGGMYQQSIYIDNGRHGFWGNLADGIEGFVRGFTNVSWLMGGMQNMFGMGMGMPMGMPMMQMPVQQTAEQQTDTSENTEYNNLKKFGEASGYTTIVKESDGTYTAFNPKTGEHISGDYKTVRDAILKNDEEVEPKKKEPEDNENQEVKPQGANDGETVKAEEFKKFEGKSVMVTDELRIKNGEDPDLVNITGKTTFGEMDKSGYPATITVGNVKYTLSNTSYGEEKAVLYKSDKKGEEYRLEWKDGNPILIQHEDDIALGAGDIDVHLNRKS